MYLDIIFFCLTRDLVKHLSINLDELWHCIVVHQVCLVLSMSYTTLNLTLPCLHDATLCDKVCQSLATGRWFSPGILVSSTIKTDRYITILLKYC